MTNSKLQYHAKNMITYFDACSVYPSAMYFMLGFLMGMTKVLTDTSYDFVKHQDGYFIRIQLIKLNKHLDVPLTSKINEDGVRDFTNDMDNKIYIYIYIYVDNVPL